LAYSSHVLGAIVRGVAYKRGEVRGKREKKCAPALIAIFRGLEGREGG